MIHNRVGLTLVVHEIRHNSVGLVALLYGGFDGIEKVPGVIKHIDDDVVVDSDRAHCLLKALKADHLLSDQTGIPRL